MIFDIERFDFYTKEYYHGEGVYFDLTEEEINEMIKEWKQRMEQKCNKNRKKRTLTANTYDIRWILSSIKNKYPKCCPMKDGECEPRWNDTLIKLVEDNYDGASKVKVSTMPSGYKGHKQPYRTEKALLRHINNCPTCLNLEA